MHVPRREKAWITARYRAERRAIVAIGFLTVFGAMAACAPRDVVPVRCAPPNEETTETTQRPNGLLVACVAGATVRLFARDESGIAWLDSNQSLIFRRRGNKDLHLATIDGDHRADAIVMDRPAIYVAASDRIFRVSKFAPSKAEVVVTGRRSIRAIDVDEEHVYWTENGLSGNESSVLRWPKRGGDVEVFAESLTSVGEISVDQEDIYWVTDEVSTAERLDPEVLGRLPRGVRARRRCEIPSRVMVKSKKGGPARVLGEASCKWATDDPEAAAIDDPGERVLHVAVDATHVYWTTIRYGAKEATIRRTSKRDGATSVLANLDGIDALALSRTQVHALFRGQLWRVAKAGGAPVKRQARGCEAIITDSDTVYCGTSYWTSTAGPFGRIERVDGD